MSNIDITNSGGNVPVNGILFLQGNDSVSVGADPSTHVIKVLGNNTQGVNVTGNAGTHIETITMFDATTTQKGVVLLATNAETITGANTTKVTTPDDIKAKLGVQTLHGIPYGNATTGAIQWLAEAQDGFFPIGDTGGVPILGTVTSLDGSITVILGPGTIDLSASSAKGTATTVGAVTANVLTIPLGGTPGTFQFEARVKAFESTTPAGAGYNIFATIRTDGTNATVIGNQPIFNEDDVLEDADAYFIADGSNNAILQVLGVAGLTINWSGETEVT